MDLCDTLETSHFLFGDGVKQLPSYQRHGALLQLLLVLDLDIRDGNVLVLAKHTDRGTAVSQCHRKHGQQWPQQSPVRVQVTAEPRAAHP